MRLVAPAEAHRRQALQQRHALGFDRLLDGTSDALRGAKLVLPRQRQILDARHAGRAHDLLLGLRRDEGLGHLGRRADIFGQGIEEALPAEGRFRDFGVRRLGLGQVEAGAAGAWAAAGSAMGARAS